MHARLIERLLDEEADAVRTNAFLMGRLDAVERDGRTLVVGCTAAGDIPYQLRFGGDRYDADPFSLAVHEPGGDALPGHRWPGSLYFGQEHPVLGRPFSCLRGLAEYHLHPSHVHDPWERVRHVLRFPTLLAHVLNKAAIK